MLSLLATFAYMGTIVGFGAFAGYAITRGFPPSGQPNDRWIAASAVSAALGLLVLYSGLFLLS